MSDDNADKKSRLLAFGSLKGGVGKTTLSLLAVEALIALRAEQRKQGPTSVDLPVGVILIDADIVGTEASDVVGTEYEPHDESLAEIIGRVPDGRSVYAYLEDKIKHLLEKDRERYLIRSFRRDELEVIRREWREVLEHSGLYIERRMLDLVRVCRAAKLDVVVDLPAFDVGFAHKVRTGLAADKPTVFFVTDCDVRSLRATLIYLRDFDKKSGDDLRIAVNRTPPDADREPIRDVLSEHALEKTGVLLQELRDVLHATRANQAGGIGGDATASPPEPAQGPAPLHGKLRALLKLENKEVKKLFEPPQTKPHRSARPRTSPAGPGRKPGGGSRRGLGGGRS